MREILLSLTVLLSVAIMVACSDGLPEEFSAPDFVLKDVFTGNNIKLSDFKGSPIILYFFASW